MQLIEPFIRLPLAFDATRLASEIAHFTERDWRPHPQGHPGNWALPLIAPNNDPMDDGVAGAMGPVPKLRCCRYLRQVLGSLSVPLGRTRLMRLDPTAEATPHIDVNYYWLQRVRVHVPIQTWPEVRFVCGDAAVHMGSGECWIFDTWRPHNVLNPTSRERIHLVVDTVGSASFWEMVEQGGPARAIDFDPKCEPQLVFEANGLPSVMSPWEIEALLSHWFNDARQARGDRAAIDALEADLRPLLRDWRAQWATDGNTARASYLTLVARFNTVAARQRGRIFLSNGLDLARCIEGTLAPALVSPEVVCAPASASTRVLNEQRTSGEVTQRIVEMRHAGTSRRSVLIVRPVIIVSAPRSGSSVLYETLARSPDLFNLGGESHQHIESVPSLRPEIRGFDSNRLDARDLTHEIAIKIKDGFASSSFDRHGQPPSDGEWRLLEKTPKNALRVPFLDALFPDALFVFLYRDPNESVSSLIEGWQSGRFVTYRDLPGWTGLPWSYLLVPGWRDLIGRPLPAVCAAQWLRTQQNLLDDLATLPRERVFAVRYRDLIEDPTREISAICEFAGITWDCGALSTLPLSNHTVSLPHPDKWRRHEAGMADYLVGLASTAERARDFVAASRTYHLADRGRTPRVAGPSVASVPVGNSSESVSKPLSSVHTTNLREILRELRISLMITTYQAGKVVIVRADNSTLNTHFIDARKPMGLCADRHRMVVGTETGLREFRNVPAVTARVSPPGRNDAVYVFRNHHVTGNIDVHEVAIGDEGIWYVNTRFSCLCTVDQVHSFVPRWRPRFVSGLAPEDRCHLNGIAMVDGRPRFTTALGRSDTPEGWRRTKNNGGVLIDCDGGDVFMHSLAMPHSPRWWRDRLWFLESATGSLCTVDLDDGRLNVVTKLPGFTRGLDFAGPLAFVGLSQLREPNAFADIPIADSAANRACGIWVVNVETGATVAFLKFDGLISEIFAVQVLHGTTFPDVLDETDHVLETTYVLPESSLRDVRFSN